MLSAPQGQFELQRFPRRRRELLRAWDAADEYLLEYVAELGEAPSRILILNDSFGALAVALNSYAPQALSDSWLSQQATRENLAGNGLDPAAVRLWQSLQQPEGPIDWLLIKLPKNLGLLEDQLVRLRPLLTPDTRTVVAGMVKHMPRTLWPLLERLVGPTDTLLARKKARLIVAAVDPELPRAVSPYPKCWQLEGTGYQITNHANVFSRDSLDIGTRLFLQQLPAMPGARDIVDLGCGNGVVGLIAAERNPTAVIHFTDESFMALASAETNFRAAFGDARKAVFTAGDGLMAFAAESADLILCNPPFHQQHTVGDQIATAMFRQSRRVLRSGGELWVVGNRHLGYHALLKRLFGNVELVASNAKFVVLRTARR